MGFTIVLRSNKYNIFFEFYIRKSFNIATMTNSMEVAQVIKNKMAISSIQFSCSVVSDSLQPHELQHARPPCPSPTPGVHSNPCLSSRCCHPAISFSVVPFSCPQSLPASGSFPMSQLFAWGGQSIGVSAKKNGHITQQIH